MQRKPKEQAGEKKDKRPPENEQTWEEDQRKRDYYYDDAHGYEVYKPETNDDESESD
ncbi:MAG: hypothetical protein ABR530_11225 [Pyrinomonadaceae bacterium]